MPEIDLAAGRKLLARIERHERRLNHLELEYKYTVGSERDAAGDAFEAELGSYERLLDRMVASPLWPDSVAGLRQLVDQARATAGSEGRR